MTKICSKNFLEKNLIIKKLVKFESFSTVGVNRGEGLEIEVFPDGIFFSLF